MQAICKAYAKGRTSCKNNSLTLTNLTRVNSHLPNRCINADIVVPAIYQYSAKHMGKVPEHAGRQTTSMQYARAQNQAVNAVKYIKGPIDRLTC